MNANRKPRRHQMPRKVELALDRERIMREADPIGFLSDVMRGKPIEELDWEGEFVGYARPSMDHRVVAAREPLKKVVPDLKSIDVTAADNAGITFKFESPIPLPHSQPLNTITVDANQAANQIAAAVTAQIVGGDDV